ncbi:conserved hypothetical protein [Candidatus Terasakiella magnetica]|nr:conserved hypothetical protein [Candidatus Terasakiella magnetica]
MMGRERAVPITAMGRRPPSRLMNRAPIRVSGSEIRRMGRERSDASPVKKVVKGWLATNPISRRAPVPELPMSRMSAGSIRPPIPRPNSRHEPSAQRSTSAPRARIQAAVRSTSSPSSRPVTTLSPTARAPSIKARWEMDLSPGICAEPDNAGARVETKGFAMTVSFFFPGGRAETVETSTTGGIRGIGLRSVLHCGCFFVLTQGGEHGKCPSR